MGDCDGWVMMVCDATLGMGSAGNVGRFSPRRSYSKTDRARATIDIGNPQSP